MKRLTHCTVVTGVLLLCMYMLPAWGQATNQSTGQTGQSSNYPSAQQGASQRGTSPQGMSQVPGGSAEDQIKALTKQYTDALVKGDTATLDRLMADDYISQSAASGTLNKQQYIDNIRNGDTKWDTADVSNQDVRLYGDDVAVSTATVNLKGHSKAKGDINGTYQVMRVWVKRNGQWQTVSFQSTPMSGNQSATQR